MARTPLFKINEKQTQINLFFGILAIITGLFLIGRTILSKSFDVTNLLLDALVLILGGTSLMVAMRSKKYASHYFEVGEKGLSYYLPADSEDQFVAWKEVESTEVNAKGIVVQTIGGQERVLSFERVPYEHMKAIQQAFEEAAQPQAAS